MFNCYRLYNAALGGCLAAVLLVSPALSQGKDQDTTQNPDTQAADQSAIEAPAAFAPIGPTETSSSGHNNEHQPEKRENPQDSAASNGGSVRNWFTKYIVAPDTLAQWIMALLGAVATGISVWAVILLKGTLKATRDAIDEAKQTTRIAEQSLEEARLSNQRQLRAYVHVVEIVRETHFGSDLLKIFIRVENFGDTPARNFVVRAEAIFANREETKVDFSPLSTLEPSAPTVLGPKGKTNILRGIKMAGDAHETYARGENALYVYGQIEYIDAFDGLRCTSFRMMHFSGPTDHFIMCEYGNNAT
jgi:hypothetical protein